MAQVQRDHTVAGMTCVHCVTAVAAHGAALGELKPLLVAAATAVSGILVVSNSLRLRSYVSSRRGAAGA